MHIPYRVRYNITMSSEDTGVGIILDLDGKLLQVQFRSAKEYRGQVVAEFLAAAKGNGVELKLAAGMKAEGVQLKHEGAFTDKWLLSLWVEAKEISKDSELHYDFEYSDKFYEWVKREGKKSEGRARLRLVYDECSDSRADALYPIVKDIEREFRVLALKLGIELGDSVQSRKTGEHLICNVETSELFGVLFMQPASKEFYLKKLAAAETDEQREEVRNLTIVDEIGFSEFKDFLVRMHSVRNPVMHGRYISEAKFRESLETLQRIRKKLDEDKLYKALVINEEFMKSIAEITKQMSSMTESLQKSMQPTLRIINTIVENMAPMKELTAQVSGFAKTLYGPGGIVADLSKINVSPLINIAVPKLGLAKFPLPPVQGYTSGMKIVIKRAYDEADNDDGYRVLVDRLWPRGVKKELLAVDEWCKDVAPSTELRKWFNHDPAKFKEFTVKYQNELEASTAAQELLGRAKGHATLTLVYSAKDPAVNQAVVLRDYLRNIAK